MEQKILFVINPKSGKRKNEDSESIISRYAKKYGFQFEIYITTGKDDKNRIQNYVETFNPEIVMTAGGDGTVNLVAGILIHTKINLGILPAGSANGLAFNLNIPGRFEEALNHNLNGEFKPMDVIKINHQYYCVHLADIGINARIVKRFEKEGPRGMLGYGKQLFKELLSQKTYFSCTIKTINFEKKVKAEMLVISNAQSYGTGVKINPEGKIDDGKFEVVIIKPYPWWFVLTFPFAGITGRLNKIEYVNIYNAAKANIALDRYQDFQIDGEIIGEIKNIELEILPNALYIIQA